MKNIRAFKGLTIILIIAMLITGCAPAKQVESNNENNNESNNENASNTPVKDTLTFGLIQEPVTMDPIKSAERITFLPVKAIHDPLVYMNDKKEIIPMLAESWKISDDGLEYVFTIREGVKFHNGEPLTIDDVVFTLEQLVANRKNDYGLINTVEKVSENEVKVIIDYSFSPLLFLFTKPYSGIVHKATYEKDPEAYGRNPNGTGPYKFEKWSSGDSLELVRNEEYWRGPAPIKDLTFRIIADETTELIALQAAEIDAYIQVDQSNKTIVEEDENLKWYDTPGGQVYTLAFNNGKKPNGENSIFAENKALRQAICYAINKEDLVIGATNDSVPPLYTPFPSFVINYPENFNGNVYNLEKAKEKMIEAGYPDGLTFKIKTTVQPGYAKPAEIIQSQLAQIGIKVELEKMERGTYLQEVYNNLDYDATIWAVSCDYPDAGDGAYFRFYSGMIGPAKNYMQVNDPILDEAILTNRTSMNNDEKAAAVLKYAEIIRDESYALPLYSSLNTLAANAKLKGVNIDSGMVVDFYEWSWE